MTAIVKELEALPEISKKFLNIFLFINSCKLKIFHFHHLTLADDEDLNLLEKRLLSAQEEIKAANLDKRIRTLTDAKNLQTQWVKNYEDEVNRLKLEVENIDDIKKALPTDCHKRVRLEP